MTNVDCSRYLILEYDFEYKYSVPGACIDTSKVVFEYLVRVHSHCTTYLVQVPRAVSSHSSLCIFIFNQLIQPEMTECSADGSPELCLSSRNLNSPQLTFDLLSKASPNLTCLNLSDNRITHLQQLLLPLSQLIQLDISRNHIADLRGELMTLTCLQELDISRNRLQTMDECLPPAPRLKCLLMCSCVTSSRKRQIPKELLQLSAIQHLDLRFNSLRALPAQLFRSLIKLEILQIQGNKFKELPCIRSLCCLRRLELHPHHLLDTHQLQSDIQAMPLLIEVALSDEPVTTSDTKICTNFRPDAAMGHERFYSTSSTDASNSMRLSSTAPSSPSLREQLAPLSTPTLQRRLFECFGQWYPHGSGEVHRDCLLTALVKAYNEADSKGLFRRNVYVEGRLVPAHCRDCLLRQIETVQWPRPRERLGLSSGEYLTIPRAPPSNCEGVHRSSSSMAADRKAQRYKGLFDAAEALLRLFDPAFANSFNAVAVTKNFVGSPHIDQHDIAPQYAVALGDFRCGGELCIESGPLEVVVVNTKNRIARVDGRFPHWVRPYTAGNRYSVIYFQTTGRFVPKVQACLECSD